MARTYVSFFDLDGWPAPTGPEGIEALQFGPEATEIIRSPGSGVTQASLSSYLTTVGVSHQLAVTGTGAFADNGQPIYHADYAGLDVPNPTSPLALTTLQKNWALMLKLDGGVDLNGTVPAGITDPELRDNPPAVRTDTWVGYEQLAFVDRQHPEKFAAVDTTRCQIGSPGSETYSKVIDGTFTIIDGPTSANDNNTNGGLIPEWIFHDPTGTVGGPGGREEEGGVPQEEGGGPSPEDEEGGGRAGRGAPYCRGRGGEDEWRR